MPGDQSDQGGIRLWHQGHELITDVVVDLVVVVDVVVDLVVVVVSSGIMYVVLPGTGKLYGWEQHNFNRSSVT